MKRVLLVIFALISLNAFSQIQVKEGSFKKIDGYVMMDKSEHTDINNKPMALVKITAEGMKAEERARLVYKGNMATYFDVHQKGYETYLYLTAQAATFLEIIHPDYGKTEYWFPEDLCDFCGYEMVLQYVNAVPEMKTGVLIVVSEPLEADVYIDGKYSGKTVKVITDISVGTHELEISKQGHYSVKKTVAIAAGETVNINETLQIKKEISISTDQSGDKQEHNGYEYVDLGLSVKWATCNVGATSPEEYGNYYAWGETTTKAEYNESNCPTYGLDYFQLHSQGYIDSEGNLTAQYDAATSNWGGDWRMPTEDEQRELLNNCTWTWTTQNGVNGYKVTSKTNGNSIFLPAAGYRFGSSLYYAGSDGYYWSSTPYYFNDYDACRLDFDSSSHYIFKFRRYYGLSLRPVIE